MAKPRQSPFEPVLPGQSGNDVAWRYLHGSAKSLSIAKAATRATGLIVWIVADSLTADRVHAELEFFLGGADCPVFEFPDWETLPYDRFSPYHDIVSTRLGTLASLATTVRGILVVPIATLMHRLPPVQFIAANSFDLRRGEKLDRDAFRQRLSFAGYRNVAQVMEHGDYALRGSLIDVFPMGAEQPFRIDLFDDEIESIRLFDPETQRTTGNIDFMNLLPAKEFSLSEETIANFRTQWRVRFSGKPTSCSTYNEVSQGIAPPGVEYYLPLFFERLDTLFDYLPDTALLVFDERVMDHSTRFWDSVEVRYEAKRHDAEYPLLAPEELYASTAEVADRARSFCKITCHGVAEPGSAVEYAVELAVQIPVDSGAAQPLALLDRYLQEHTGRVLIVAESDGRRETLLELLNNQHIRPTLKSDWQSFIDSDDKLALTVAPIYQGAHILEPPISIITESQLFGERASQQRRRRRASRDPESLFKDLSEMRVGAPVVHEMHGIGRYLGLISLDAGGIPGEYLSLEYADHDKLYVPVASLQLISRYAGFEPEHAPLHKLGSGQWERAKEKAAKRIYDVAAELLEIHARRAARRGHRFDVNHDAYQTFCAAFPFEETPDQDNAIGDVLKDMQGELPMDRLICGDVGFGKTEVALRAAFVAVHDDRQVAVLVPTTLLAQQHFRNFSDRFADWPISVQQLSRFRSKEESADVLRALNNGSADIVIATHKLLQNDVKFKRLGLIIVDEEHRFGVRQKERLKSLRAEVDVLTLTATPIPRTLNLSLSGVRDLSLIATPPARRLAIKTFIGQWDADFIREAMLREINRGGQTYILHNKVEDIENFCKRIATLVPEAQIRIAHGQMRERDLERVMLDFYHRRFNVLVCTTIIESGIDVPSANTMIIDQADRFGLAQLYQLRGRVGRSHHRAYAYLVVPHTREMTADAIKRLEALESLEELGSGFNLAAHDLEIRGAGEILGEEQSGHIQAIGFGLYNELLRRAVGALKSGVAPQLDRSLDHGPEVDLHMPTLIPEDLLPDVHARLILYKRIASAKTPQDLTTLKEEIIDRFGTLPEPTRNLFDVAGIKLAATPLGIKKIEMGPRGGRFVFDDEPNIDPDVVIRLLQSEPDIYRLESNVQLKLRKQMPEPNDRLQAVHGLLGELGAPAQRPQSVAAG